jgi:hypothetical protein
VNPEWSRQEKEEYNIHFLIGTVETGGVGVPFNIADPIVLLEPHWTLKAEKQAFGQVDRIGNLNPYIHSYRLAAESRVGGAIILRQRNRNELMAESMDQNMKEYLDKCEEERRAQPERERKEDEQLDENIEMA